MWVARIAGKDIRLTASEARSLRADHRFTVVSASAKYFILDDGRGRGSRIVVSRDYCDAHVRSRIAEASERGSTS